MLWRILLLVFGLWFAGKSIDGAMKAWAIRTVNDGSNKKLRKLLNREIVVNTIWTLVGLFLIYGALKGWVL